MIQPHLDNGFNNGYFENIVPMVRRKEAIRVSLYASLDPAALQMNIIGKQANNSQENNDTLRDRTLNKPMLLATMATITVAIAYAQ